jgi:hypothetical protein
VSCIDEDVKDGYGEHVSRANSCYDTSKTVVVMVSDT